MCLQDTSGVCCPCSQSLQAPGSGFQAVLAAPFFFPGLSLPCPQRPAPSADDKGPDLVFWCKWAQSQLCPVEFSRGQWKGGWSDGTVLGMVDPVCCLISQWVWKQILIHLGQSLCFSLFIPVFSSQFSRLLQFFSPFLHFSCSSGSLTTSSYYSQCKIASIHILLISQRAEKGFAITIESRFCFVMIYYILLWPLLCTLHW